MDLLAGVEVTNADVTVTKKVRVKDAKREEELSKMLLEMGKIVLAADQNGRLMRGVIMQSMKLATESWPIVAVKKGVQGYLNAQGTLKDKGNSQDVIQKHLGPPAVHGFNGLVQHFVAMEIKEPEKKKSLITAQLKIKEA
eukprot:8160701-Karenia_brevis.AAC.1